MSKEALQVLAELINMRADRQKEDQLAQEAENVRKQSSAFAYWKAAAILGQYGERSTTLMDRGGGTKIIGSRIELIFCLKTPPLPAELEGHKGVILLKRNPGLITGYNFDDDSLDVSYDVSGISHTLFTIKPDSVKSIEGQLKSIEQFLKLNKVLEFLTEGYKALPRRQEPPPSLPLI